MDLQQVKRYWKLLNRFLLIIHRKGGVLVALFVYINLIMAVQIIKDGGLLLVEVDGVSWEPMNLNTLEIQLNLVDETIKFQNGNIINYADVTVPTSTDLEDLIDQIGAFI